MFGLGRTKLTNSIRPTLRQICVPVGVKQKAFGSYAFYFIVGRYNKTLAPQETVSFVSFRPPCSIGLASGNIEGHGETKLTVSLAWGQSLSVYNITFMLG